MTMYLKSEKKTFVWLGILLCLVMVPQTYAQLDESLLTWTPERGISLNGTTDYIEVEDAEDFNLNQLTVEAWVKFRDNTGQQQIMGRGAAGEFFTFYADRGNGRFLVEGVDVGHESAISEVPPANTWVHMAGTYDEENIRLYYNGVMMVEQPFNGVTRFGEAPLRIGALVPGERHLNGLLDNLRIWNRALSQEEIAQLLATPPSEENIDEMTDNGLIAYWSERSVEGNIINDLAGDHEAAFQKYTLDESNLTFKPEGGISFDGKSTYIIVEDGTPFNLPAFTLEVWVRFDDTHENQVFMNRGGAPNDFTFYLYDQVRFLVQDVSGYNHADGRVPPAQSWVHILGTHAEDGTNRIYYNGILQDESVVPAQPLDSDNPLYIGALEPGSRHLDGQLENLRIWNRDLSEAEILELLQTPPEDEDIDQMKDDGLVAYWSSRSLEGDTVIDLTGNGHDGVFHTFEIDETNLTFKPETGIAFDGVSTYAVVQNAEPFNVNQISIEAWLYLDPVFHIRDLGDRGIIGRGGINTYFSLYGSSHYGNKIHMLVEEFGDVAAVMPPAESWIHVCGVYDEESVQLYYNGQMADEVDAPGILYWGGDPLFIGAINEEAGFFEGQMENIRIWGKPLSQNDIIDLLATPPSEENISEMSDNGLIAYYSSRAMSDNQLEDLSGNEIHAELFGAVVPVEEWSLY